MSARLKQLRLPIALLLLCAIIVTTWILMDHWLAQVLDDARSLALEPARDSGSEAIGKLPTQRALPTADYEQLVERPLFISTRRPPPLEEEGVDEEVTEKADEKTPDLRQLTLISVMITPSERSAWFRAPTGGQPLRRVPGDEIQEWTLVGIQPDSVVLRAQNTEKRLELRTAEPPPPKPVPGARTQLRRRKLTPKPATGAGG
jgi:hypothetical protein